MLHAAGTPTRELLTTREAAAYLGISPRTLWTLSMPRGPIPCSRIGKRIVRYRRDDLRTYTQQCVQGPRPQSA